MSDIEEICRIVCKAEGVDPDASGIGLGALMPAGKVYLLWQARRHVAEALLTEGYRK